MWSEAREILYEGESGTGRHSNGKRAYMRKNLKIQEIELEWRGCDQAQSYLTLCNTMDSGWPGSSVRGISQARILEWVAFPSPRDLPDLGIEPTSLMSPVLSRQICKKSRHLGSPGEGDK